MTRDCTDYLRGAISVSPVNQDYQRRMADSLVDDMGTRKAASFALENGWDGVLAQIRRPVNQLVQGAGGTIRS